MLQFLFSGIRWLGAVASVLGFVVSVSFLADYGQQPESRSPTSSDIDQVAPAPPPGFPTFHVRDDSAGMYSKRQRSGGAMVTSRLKDPRHAEFSDPGRNYPLPLPEGHAGRGLYLLVVPHAGSAFHDNFSRSTVALVNATDALLEFRSIQGNLPTVQEAIAPDGNWKPIESFPSVDASSAQSLVYLPPKHYWLTKVRGYRGDFATRARLTLKLTGGMRLISNEFDQNIAVSQFNPEPEAVPLNPGDRPSR